MFYVHDILASYAGLVLLCPYLIYTTQIVCRRCSERLFIVVVLLVAGGPQVHVRSVDGFKLIVVILALCISCGQLTFGVVLYLTNHADIPMTRVTAFHLPCHV